MRPEEILNLLEPWRDPINGFISHRKGGETGNGAMYTGVVTALIDKLCKTVWGYVVIPQVVAESLIAPYEKVEDSENPGLFKRNVNKGGGHNANDDYFGIGVASMILDNGAMAKRVLEYGRKTGGHFNDQEPGKFRWKSILWRMPQLESHLQFCAKEIPNPYWQLVWAFSLLITCFRPKEDQDGHRKAWLTAQTLPNLPMHLRVVVMIWDFVFYRRFPRGIAEIEESYGFSLDHPEIVLGEGL